MITVNWFITYLINFAFSKLFINFRFNSTNSIVIAVSVFTLNCWFLGIFPTLIFNSSEHSMPREWYLKAGVLHMLYFFGILILHPFEILFVIILRKIQQLCNRKTAVIQKEMNKALLGWELNYAHKIGRLLAHGFIAFLLAPGLPLLPLIFLFHLFIF